MFNLWVICINMISAPVVTSGRLVRDIGWLDWLMESEVLFKMSAMSSNRLVDWSVDRGKKAD